LAVISLTLKFRMTDAEPSPLFQNPPSWLVGKCLVRVLAIGRWGWKTLVCEGLG